MPRLASPPTPRPARRIAVGLVLTALLGVLLPVVVSQPAAAAVVNGVTLNRYEASLVNAINVQRTARGLRPLTVAAGPTDVARRWTYHLAAAGGLSHNPALGSQLDWAGSHWSWMAENVGYAGAGDPAGLMSAYLASAPHRANILSPRARYLGIGVVDAVVDGYRFAFNTLDFTDTYSTGYGRTREPADAMPLDGGAITSSRAIATFEQGWDARLRTVRSSPDLAVSAPSYSGPTSADDVAAFSVRAVTAGTRGGADLVLRSALDLTRVTSLRLTISTRSPSGRSLPVQVLLTDGTTSTVLATVPTSATAHVVTVPVPPAARRFADTLRIRVSAAQLATLGGSLSSRVLTVRLAQVAAVV